MNKYYESENFHMNRLNVPILPTINKIHEEKYKIYREKYNNDKKIKEDVKKENVSFAKKKEHFN